jgi:hypothetical protein
MKIEMLTKTFNSNSIFSIILFIVMAIVLWAKVFMNTVPMSAPIPASPLYHLFFKFFGGLPIVCALISLALLIMEALLINHLLVENDIIPRKSLMAAFLYIIFLSLFNETIILNPALISGFFIILSLWLILRLYEEEEAYQHVFNIGTLISIASMFYFPSIVFMLIVWIGFIIYRVFKWREWFISIVGLICPYLFLASYYFWNDCLVEKFKGYVSAFDFIDPHSFHPSSYVYVNLGFLSLLILASLFKLLMIINEKQIRIRKFLSILIWFFIISFGGLGFSANYGITGFLLTLIPMSVLISLFISIIKRPLIGDIVLIVLLLLMVSGRIGLWDSM